MKRIVRWVGWIVGILVVGLYLVFPLGMGVAAVVPARENVGEPPPGFEVVKLVTADGVELAAWYLPPANGATIILLHGAGGSREGMRGYAQMLARHDYGVLALDLRGHGLSGGGTNRLGWNGTNDVGAAVDFLLGRDETQKIGGMGLSMGGEVLLGAASAYPSIAAMVADGATRRCTEELLALPAERPLVRNFTARVMYTTVEVLSGETPPLPLLESMVAAKSTQYLWIAGGSKALETDFNRLFDATLGERGTLWIAPEAGHTQAFQRYPEEYEQHVIGFFEAALSDAASQ